MVIGLSVTVSTDNFKHTKLLQRNWNNISIQLILQSSKKILRRSVISSWIYVIYSHNN
jgi:hypothetical protein